jgi:hypothetical protein
MKSPKMFQINKELFQKKLLMLLFKLLCPPSMRKNKKNMILILDKMLSFALLASGATMTDKCILLERRGKMIK